VLAQTHPCTHYFVADGHPKVDIDAWNVKHIVLADCHRDNGNTPRGIGGISAINSGFDAVAFLDADNWFSPNHISSLITTIEQTQAAVAVSGRTIVLIDGTVLEMEDPEDRVGSHIDTSCYFITTKAAFLIPLWAMLDQSLSPVGDRMMRSFLAYFQVPVALTGLRTMMFESNYEVHYRMAGREPPALVHAVDAQAVLATFDSQRCYERTRIVINADRQG
jgi:hypothetical protein